MPASVGKEAVKRSEVAGRRREGSGFVRMEVGLSLSGRVSRSELGEECQAYSGRLYKGRKSWTE